MKLLDSLLIVKLSSDIEGNSLQFTGRPGLEFVEIFSERPTDLIMAAAAVAKVAEVREITRIERIGAHSHIRGLGILELHVVPVV